MPNLASRHHCGVGRWSSEVQVGAYGAAPVAVQPDRAAATQGVEASNASATPKKRRKFMLAAQTILEKRQPDWAIGIGRRSYNRRPRARLQLFDRKADYARPALETRRAARFGL